jgi:hypothetical protein
VVLRFTDKAASFDTLRVLESLSFADIEVYLRRMAKDRDSMAYVFVVPDEHARSLETTAISEGLKSARLRRLGPGKCLIVGAELPVRDLLRGLTASDRRGGSSALFSFAMAGVGGLLMWSALAFT